MPTKKSSSSKEPQRKKKSPTAKPSEDLVTIDTTKLSIERSVSIPLAWVDRMELVVRAGAPIATLRFYSVLPEAVYEAARLQTSVQHLKGIVDVICRHIDYYPERSEGSPKMPGAK